MRDLWGCGTAARESARAVPHPFVTHSAFAPFPHFAFQCAIVPHSNSVSLGVSEQIPEPDIDRRHLARIWSRATAVSPVDTVDMVDMVESFAFGFFEGRSVTPFRSVPAVPFITGLAERSGLGGRRRVSSATRNALPWRGPSR